MWEKQCSGAKHCWWKETKGKYLHMLVFKPFGLTEADIWRSKASQRTQSPNKQQNGFTTTYRWNSHCVITLSLYCSDYCSHFSSPSLTEHLLKTIQTVKLLHVHLWKCLKWNRPLCCVSKCSWGHFDGCLLVTSPQRVEAKIQLVFFKSLPRIPASLFVVLSKAEQTLSPRRYWTQRQKSTEAQQQLRLGRRRQEMEKLCRTEQAVLMRLLFPGHVYHTMTIIMCCVVSSILLVEIKLQLNFCVLFMCLFLHVFTPSLKRVKIITAADNPTKSPLATTSFSFVTMDAQSKSFCADSALVRRLSSCSQEEKYKR